MICIVTLLPVVLQKKNLTNIVNIWILEQDRTVPVSKVKN